jgi:hypothetical protein
MARGVAKLFASLILVSLTLSAQGLNTTVSKDDWEEINFEFNSSVLTDGFPSLLRLAELLNKNADYKVKLIGHADYIGSHPYNDRLGTSRANAVKAFLEKYGARAGQISAETKGETTPRVSAQSREARWMNRRVEMTVTDGAGKVVGAGGAADVVKALEALAKKQEECCSQILRRLDKLDDILAQLKDLKTQNDKLQADVDELKRRPAPAAGPAGSAGAAGAAGVPGAAGAAGVPGAAGVAGAPGAGAAGAPGQQLTAQQAQDLADKAAKKAVDEMRTSRGVGGPGGAKLSVLGLNAGPDSTGNVTFTGKGRFFAPFSENLAFQAQGEYMYFRDRKEGQFDLGLVNRWDRIQLGGFASFKTVGMRDMQNNGTLGQMAFTGDYLFKHGKVGVFGTKSFLDNAVINRVNPTVNGQVRRNIVDETYLRVVDQIGGQTSLQLGPRAYLEANLGYLHSRAGNDKPGGTVRFVFPINRMFALTAEGGFNETMLERDTNGRATFGILFGNYMQPREFLDAGTPVPVDVPRLRFEVLTRRLVTGNDPPVVDAGPDQVGVAAGTIRLDGSASFDPDGDPIRFRWSQIAGPTVALTGADTATPTFPAAEGNMYAFRLTVTDDKGAQGIGRVSVTTRATPRVRIVRFTSNPALIRPGQEATLNYLVENAESVTITGVTQTLSNTTGTVAVKPIETTVYTLTAKNAVSEDTATVSVVVDQPLPRILRFAATPATIDEGGKTMLSWQTADTDSVDILPGVGMNLSPNGQIEVSPAESTAYTIVAKNRAGESRATAIVTVRVIGAGERVPPRIVEFAAQPNEIIVGGKSTLRWFVENADEVSISPAVGKVNLSGTADVTPPSSTTYVLTAKNRFGESTARATVQVFGPVRILAFTVTQDRLRNPGQRVTFDWATDNARYVVIDPAIGQREANGSLSNAGPTRTQTYTLTAVGFAGSVATATVTVTVEPPADPTINQPPQAVVSAGVIRTASTELMLDASRSFDPERGSLTFSWRSIDGNGAVNNPASATPTVRLVNLKSNIFDFEVTVKDEQGLISKATVRVIYVPAGPPPARPN